MHRIIHRYGRDRISFLEISAKKWGGGVPFGRYFKDDWVLKHNHLDNVGCQYI